VSLLSVSLSYDILTIHVSLPYMTVGIAIIVHNFSCDSNPAFPFMVLLIVPHIFKSCSLLIDIFFLPKVLIYSRGM